MDDQPEVGAVVVNYNAGHRLLMSVRALLQQSELARVCVVDNASTDDSLKAVAPLSAADQRLTIIRNSENIGFGAANNMVLRASPQMDWLLVNPDCVLEPGAVKALLACRQEQARGGLFGGLICNPDGSEQRGSRRDLPRPGVSLARSLGVSHLVGRRRWATFDHAGGPLPEAPVRVGAASGAFMYLRTDAMRDVGVFDEGYFLHCEDLDMCRRMGDAGWQVWFVPGARAVHFQGTSSRRAPLRVHWHKHRGMWRYYSKFEAAKHIAAFNALVFTGIWLRFIVTGGVLSLRHLVMPRRD